MTVRGPCLTALYSQLQVDAQNMLSAQANESVVLVIIVTI